jgi:hypothetical protein
LIGFECEEEFNTPETQGIRPWRRADRAEFVVVYAVHGRRGLFGDIELVAGLIVGFNCHS